MLLFIHSACIHAKLLQSCRTLCDAMDSSPLGSTTHGNFQARIQGWVVMPSSRGSSQPRDRTCVSYVSNIGRQVLYHLSQQGSILHVANLGHSNTEEEPTGFGVLFLLIHSPITSYRTWAGYYL